VKDGDKIRIITMEEFVVDGIKEPTSRCRNVTSAEKGPGSLSRHRLRAEYPAANAPYIDRVLPGSPAHKSKLQPDDLLVYVDGEPVYTIQTFRDLVTKLKQRQDPASAAAND
jgi:S1-C subfamily serine protease